ncbi:MAG: hypothetical protein ACTHNK_08345 [Thermomicrobiales bacterium]|nr:hypothetical protein [Thermomicrobiales bacterium]
MILPEKHKELRPGMRVLTADDQVLGKVESLSGNGFLVNGQFIPGTEIRQVTDNEVHLVDNGAQFKPWGAERGDQA